MDKIEYKDIGTSCAETKTSQGVDNANQKVKWFPKVHKPYKLLWKHIVDYLFS